MTKYRPREFSSPRRRVQRWSRKALRSKAQRRPTPGQDNDDDLKNGLYWLNIDEDGQPEIGAYSGRFFEDET